MAIQTGRVGVRQDQVSKTGKIKVATSETIGGVQPVEKTEEMTQDVGVDEEGKLYTYPAEEYSLPIATDTILGGVKIGDGIDVDQTGIIEINTGDGLAIGSNSELEVNVGDGLQIGTNGEVEVNKDEFLLMPTTTDEVLVGISDSNVQEIVNIGSGLTLSNGVLSASGGSGGSGSITGTRTLLYPYNESSATAAASLNLSSTQGGSTSGYSSIKLSYVEGATPDYVQAEDFDYIYMQVQWRENASSATYPIGTYAFLIPTSKVVPILNDTNSIFARQSQTMFRIDSSYAYIGLLSWRCMTDSGDLVIGRYGPGYTSASGAYLIRMALAGTVSAVSTDGGWITISNVYGINLAT